MHIKKTTKNISTFKVKKKKIIPLTDADIYKHLVLLFDRVAAV